MFNLIFGLVISLNLKSTAFQKAAKYFMSESKLLPWFLKEYFVTTITLEKDRFTVRI